MHIVFIANEINGTTGLERMITVQTSYFVNNFNYKIDLVLIEQNKALESPTFFNLDNRVSLHFIEAGRGSKKDYFSMVKKLNTLLSSLSPDIVNVCVDDIIWLYMPLVLKKSYKIIYQRHAAKQINLDLKKKNVKTNIINQFKKVVLNNGGKAYDRFIILSNAHKQDWPHLNNLEVIGNPLIIESNGSKALLENKKVLAVGRHELAKGFNMLLESWALVVKECPDWTLKIIGKKTTTINLKTQAKHLGIYKHVEFLSYTKQMKKEYLNSSILVSSSVIEGFPLTLIEAMSLGVPVVSFDCSYGPSEIIKNEEDGLIVPVEDTVALARGLIRLIKDPELRKQMGEKAQINIQRFSPDQIMQKWKLLFESVVAN